MGQSQKPDAGSDAAPVRKTRGEDIETMPADWARSKLQTHAESLRKPESGAHKDTPAAKNPKNSDSEIEIDNPFKVSAPKRSGDVDSRLPFSPAETGSLSNWGEQHRERVQRAHSSAPDTAFFGDSITDGMQLNNSFRHLHGLSVNFGIHSDTTQNLRYRLEDGELRFKDGKAPKDFVLLIGTNDLGKGKSHEQIARDVLGDAEIIAKKFPHSNVLVLGLLPRAEFRKDVPEVNKLIKDDVSKTKAPNIRYADVGSAMLNRDGSMPTDLWQPDFTHPTYGHGNSKLLAAIKKELEARERG